MNRATVSGKIPGGFSFLHSQIASESPVESVREHQELEILASSNIAGVAIVANKNGRQFFVFGHAEYDRNTLANEYFRDSNKGLKPQLPYNYFPGNDPRAVPALTWRSYATILYSNWLNYFVYQQTPYDLSKLKEMN